MNGLQNSKKVQGATNEIPSLSTRQCKVVNDDLEMQRRPITSGKLTNKEGWTTNDLQCQLPPKKLNQGNFTLPCTIGNFNFYGMADLDFMVIDKTPNETIILGRPFLATIHVEINVFDKEFSLGTNNDRVSYDMEKRDHNFTIPTEKIYMIKSDLENRPLTPASSNNQPRNLHDREWTLLKVGHTDISEPVKKVLLRLWLIDYFRDESGIIKEPLARGFYDYKWVFDLEIDQLADEYELGIGKKGHMLDKIWEYCEDVYRDNTDWWHDHGLEEEERKEMGIEIEKYDPPKVQVETFEVKKYSFKIGQKFVCVTKEIDDTLPLGSKSGSRFREMIRKEFDKGSSCKEAIFETVSKRNYVVALLI
ncbi:hypothetical protein Tco_0017494 [Tanacetum coccineum]